MAEKSSSGQPELQWDAIAAYLESHIKYEPYMVRENFGFRNLDSMFALVEMCLPFHRIISTRPSKFLPNIVSAFFYNWNKGDSISTHTVSLGTQKSVHHINVLDAVKAAFGIGDGGALQLSDITRPQLQEVCDRVLIEQRPYLERTFKRNELRPKYRLLVDFVQRCFLGHLGNHDQITPLKFQIMTAVVLNLPISWAKLMVTLLWEEARQIDCTLEGEAVVKVRLHNEKRPIRLGTKATCIIISFFKQRKWTDAEAFPHNFIPKDLHQLEMALGVAPQIFHGSPDHIRPHLIRTGQSKIGWRVPTPPVQKKKRKADDVPLPSRPAKKTPPPKKTKPSAPSEPSGRCTVFCPWRSWSH